MNVPSTALVIGMSASALGAEPADMAARAVALCMDIPLDGVALSETFREDGWQVAPDAAMDSLAAAHACDAAEADTDASLATAQEALTEQFSATLNFAGAILSKSGTTVLAADNRGGDILDRICFIAAPAAPELDTPLPLDASRPALGYIARETEAENFVEAYGWRGDHQIHTGTCNGQAAIKIRRLMRKIPQ